MSNDALNPMEMLAKARRTRARERYARNVWPGICSDESHSDHPFDPEHEQRDVNRYYDDDDYSDGFGNVRRNTDNRPQS